MGTAIPAKNPCGSCPYRKDVPSGVWAAEEYDKLPAYDNETGLQPPGAFFCHQQNGRLCAGWVACHDMPNALGLRLALAFDAIDFEDFEAACDYTTDIPIWESGAAAAEHGKADIDAPSEKASRTVERILKKPSPMAPRSQG